MASLRILMADDNRRVRSGVKVLLELHRGWTVCGEAANGIEAIAQAAALKPDLILLDLSMPELDGLTALPLIRQQAPNAAIILLTLHESLDLARTAAGLGVVAYIAKSLVTSELIPTIEHLQADMSSFVGNLLDGGTR